MTKEQKAHAMEIATAFATLMAAKYHQGAVSHGGRLWERSNIFLVEQAIDEAIDQFVYLYTLRKALLKDPANSVYISQDKDRL